MAATDGSAALTKEEWEGLPSRPVLPEENDAPPLLASVQVAGLLHRDNCISYLDWLGKHIGSPSRRVTASMLAKRYAFLLAAPVLHAMSVYNKGLLLSPEESRLVSPDYSGHDKPMTKFPELMANELTIISPSVRSRDIWRDDVLQRLFAGHLSPLFRALSDAANVPMAILWENAAVRIVPQYEDEPAEPYAGGDYEYLSSPSAARLFDLRRNPLSAFMGKTTGSSVHYSARPRMTCCLYYEMAPEYCRKCPKIKQRSGT